jgi:hypothetical protein
MITFLAASNCLFETNPLEIALIQKSQKETSVPLVAIPQVSHLKLFLRFHLFGINRDIVSVCYQLINLYSIRQLFAVITFPF